MESSRLVPERPPESTPAADLQVDLVVLPPRPEDDEPTPRSEAAVRKGVRPTCPYCRVAVEKTDAKVACGDCLAWLHAECLQEHGSCAACGSVAVLRPGTPAPGPNPAIRVRRRVTMPRIPCGRCGNLFEMVHHLPDRTTCGPCETRYLVSAFGWLAVAGALVLIMLGLASLI